MSGAYRGIGAPRSLATCGREEFELVELVEREHETGSRVAAIRERERLAFEGRHFEFIGRVRAGQAGALALPDSGSECRLAPIASAQKRAGSASLLSHTADR